MHFGAVASADAAGGILAHTIRAGAHRWKKGRQLTPDDCRALAAAGVNQVVVAMPAADDLLEDDAARRVAALFAGAGIRHNAPFTGRVNITAAAAGLLCYDPAAVHALNAVHPHVTAATLPPATAVQAGDVLATIKIIPFALAAATVAAAESLPAAPLQFSVRPFTRVRAALLQTGDNTALADKTRRLTAARLSAYGASIVAERRTAHDPAALTAALKTLTAEHAPALILIAGDSAISDERDTVPAALIAAGGTLTRVGMPVDPGNLLLLAQLGDVPVIGMPGCAKSPKLNGFDWVLARAIADLPPTAADIARMGVGGLLADTRDRPLPRQAPRRHAVAALLLAAGAARRMGGDNKLLRHWRGKPLLTHAAHTIEQARQQGLIGQTIAVTGRDGDAVAALLPPAFTRAHNPRYAEGMAGSLACGISALDDNCDAALIFLADMPRIEITDVAALTNAAAAAPDADIIVPQHRGKRGNPVLLRRRLFPTLLQLDGDAGARALFSQAKIDAVDAGPGVLHDVDTPAAFTEDETETSDTPVETRNLRVSTHPATEDK